MQSNSPARDARASRGDDRRPGETDVLDVRRGAGAPRRPLRSTHATLARVAAVGDGKDHVKIVLIGQTGAVVDVEVGEIWDHLYAAVHRHVPFLVTLDEAVEVMRVLDAAREGTAFVQESGVDG